jgi:TonB family protein
MHAMIVDIFSEVTTMSVRSIIIAAGLIAAVPAFAQAPDPKAAQNSANWDVFLKLYPPRALAAKEEGAVGFAVTLDDKGLVTNCQVTHSSGHPLLDEETCKLVTMNAQFKPDAGLAPSQVKTHQGVIAWKLPDSTTRLSTPQAVSSSTAPEKVVCKKSIKTGTLASVERTCMTPREWARQADEMKQPWEDMQGKKGSTSGN